MMKVCLMLPAGSLSRIFLVTRWLEIIRTQKISYLLQFRAMNASTLTKWLKTSEIRFIRRWCTIIALETVMGKGGDFPYVCWLRIPRVEVKRLLQKVPLYGICRQTSLSITGKIWTRAPLTRRYVFQPLDHWERAIESCAFFFDFFSINAHD